MGRVLLAVVFGLTLAGCGVKGDLEPPAGVEETGPRDIILVPPRSETEPAEETTQ